MGSPFPEMSHLLRFFLEVFECLGNPTFDGGSDELGFRHAHASGDVQYVLEDIPFHSEAKCHLLVIGRQRFGSLLLLEFFSEFLEVFVFLGVSLTGAGPDLFLGFVLRGFGGMRLIFGVAHFILILWVVGVPDRSPLGVLMLTVRTVLP